MCCMGVAEQSWKRRQGKKEGGKKKRYQTKVLSLGKEVIELQIVESCAVFWEEWKRVFLYDCSGFHCSLSHLLLAAPGDRIVGQAGYLV